MRIGFYPKLALTGIYKNKKTYFPYILTSIGMVMMMYIVWFLACSSSVAAMPGGGVVQGFLNLGGIVIGIFSTILLFYTNSFLIRRRKREFGLYNILGMGKINLARIMVWETLMIAVFSILAGLGCGVLFSKLTELAIGRIIGGSTGFAFEIKASAIVQTVIWFGVIFGLILINALRQVYQARPIELMHSEAYGEKPPKANWFFALLGLVLLVGAYYLAVTIVDPLSAMMLFFVAVVMVILGTYLLFIAGSVAFCRILQKNKGYYYKTNHFISISSMVYRMKRNGAGLASICILSTMVLVMISSTACLYIGREDSLRQRYPQDIVIELPNPMAGNREEVAELVDESLAKYGEPAHDNVSYQYMNVSGYLLEDQVIFDHTTLESIKFSELYQFFMITLDEYNRMTGQSEKLGEDEVLIYTEERTPRYPWDTINFEQGIHYQVRHTDVPFMVNGNSMATVMAPLLIVLPDEAALDRLYEVQASVYGEMKSNITEYYGFNLACSDKKIIEIYNDITTKMSQKFSKGEGTYFWMTETVALEREGFYSLFSGFFILGILLGIVFICGAVLIMYYKQIIEGYEDQSRFEILQKVGMTQREIRKSINSQILTVFFMPLLTAGIHMAFAFPLIQKLLLLFGVVNGQLLVLVTLGCFLIFAAFYILVYLGTSKAYYKIVSGKNN